MGAPAAVLREFRRLSALEERVQTDIDPRDLIGHKAVDRNGDKIGTVDEVYLDDATGRPEWAAVRTGIFGRDAFVPLTTSEFSGDELRVPYDKSLVKESPDFGVGQHLSPAQELQLYRYYGLDTPMNGRPNGRPTNGNGGIRPPDLDFGTTPMNTTTAAPLTTAPLTTAPATTDPEATMRTPSTPAPTASPAATTITAPPAASPTVEPKPRTAPAPAAGPAPSAPKGPIEITCREERLDITTEWHVLGTVKLRKYVTSEQVERRVPVVRERVRLERTPLGEAERASLTEKDIAEVVEEVTLREERPVVRKYLTQIERVRLVVERYTTEEVVHDELRREHVEVRDNTPAPDDTPDNTPDDTPDDTPHPASMRPLA